MVFGGSNIEEIKQRYDMWTINDIACFFAYVVLCYNG